MLGSKTDEGFVNVELGIEPGILGSNPNTLAISNKLSHSPGSSHHFKMAHGVPHKDGFSMGGFTCNIR